MTEFLLEDEKVKCIAEVQGGSILFTFSSNQASADQASADQASAEQISLTPIPQRINYIADGLQNLGWGKRNIDITVTSNVIRISIVGANIEGNKEALVNNVKMLYQSAMNEPAKTPLELARQWATTHRPTTPWPTNPIIR